MSPVAKYWMSPVPATSDFGGKITDEFIDGATKFVEDDGFGGTTTTRGPFGFMTPDEFKIHGIGLGSGFGQRYKKQSDGRWLKVEG